MISELLKRCMATRNGDSSCEFPFQAGVVSHEEPNTRRDLNHNAQSAPRKPCPAGRPIPQMRNLFVHGASERNGSRNGTQNMVGI
jgi:hypothetical protein